MQKITTLGAVLASMLVLASCSDVSSPGGRPPMVSLQPVRTPLVDKSASQLARETNIRQDLIARGHYSRYSPKSMTPRYITVHSTQNMSADAWQHGKALKNGRIKPGRRYLNWHFTVDQYVALQHVPVDEQAQHADGDGPGNRYSIGIEMCEHRGNSMPVTFDRTAKLVALLMKKHNIPLRNVVPHYYWTRKNCPVPLMTGGRPGYRWGWFMSRVDYHYRCINGGTSFIDV